MKYNININQLALASSNLDIVDCAILDWLIVYCNSKNQKIERNRKNGMTWINYGQLLLDMPLLRIKSKGAITSRIKKIEQDGYINTKLENGTRLYVEITSKIDELSIKSENTVHENERNRSRNKTVTVHQNEPTIILIDNNTNTNCKAEALPIKKSPFVAGKQNQSNKLAVENLAEKRKNEGITAILNEFQKWNPAVKNYYGNKTQRKACEDLLKVYGLEQVLAVIPLLTKTNKLPYVPKATTPLQLFEKYISIKDAIESLKTKKEKSLAVFNPQDYEI